MFCETYRCTMAEAACAIRQQNAANGRWNAGAGAGDINCKDCAQGRAVAAAIDPAKMKIYTRELRNARARACERKYGDPGEEKATMKRIKKTSPEATASKGTKAPKGTKVCNRKDCKHGGKPQPLDDFDKSKNNKTDGRQAYCKSCRRRYQRDRRSNNTNPGPAPGASAHAERNAAPVHDPAGAADPLAAIFAGQPELLEKLQTLAAREYRTPIQELLYLVDCGFRGLPANPGGDHGAC